MDAWPGFLLLIQATQIKVLRELRSPCSLSHITATTVSVSFWQEGAPFEGLAPNKRRGVGSRQACCPRAEQGHSWPDRPARHPNRTADARRHLVPSPGVAVGQPPAQACPPSKKGGLGKRLYQIISPPPHHLLSIGGEGLGWCPPAQTPEPGARCCRGPAGVTVGPRPAPLGVASARGSTPHVDSEC